MISVENPDLRWTGTLKRTFHDFCRKEPLRWVSMTKSEELLQFSAALSMQPSQLPTTGTALFTNPLTADQLHWGKYLKSEEINVRGAGNRLSLARTLFCH
jgi:hypothetical protein